MCHASRREQRHFEHVSFFSRPDWLEQFEHFQSSARHHHQRGEGRGAPCATTIIITTPIGSRVAQLSA